MRILESALAVGFFLGVVIQALQTAGMIGFAMPWLGLELLDVARDVATFNLPARMGQLLGVSM